MLLVALATIAVFAIVVAMTTYLPVPFLCYEQGDIEAIRAKVTKLEKLKGGSITIISLSSEVEIDPELQKGNERVTSCSITRFVAMRGAYLPELGDRVEVFIQNRYYRLRFASLNWVLTWRRIEEELPFSGRMMLAAN